MSTEHDPHATGPVDCDQCGRRWIAVWPIGPVEPLRLECPDCGAMVPAPKHEPAPEHWSDTRLPPAPDPAAFDYGPSPLPTVLDRDLSYTTTIPTYCRRVQVDLVEPMTEVAPGVWEGTVAPSPEEEL